MEKTSNAVNNVQNIRKLLKNNDIVEVCAYQTKWFKCIDFDLDFVRPLREMVNSDEIYCWLEEKETLFIRVFRDKEAFIAFVEKVTESQIRW